MEGRVEGYVFKQILAEEGGGGGGGPTEAPPRAGEDLYGRGSSSIWSANFVTTPSFVGRLFFIVLPTSEENILQILRAFL